MKKEDILLIQEAARQSEALVGEINKVIVCFKNGQEQAGFNLILNITSRIEMVMSVLSETNLELPKNIKYEKINLVLSKVVEALEDGEFEAASDTFTYDVLPIIKEIDNQLRLRVAN